MTSPSPASSDFVEHISAHSGSLPSASRLAPYFSYSDRAALGHPFLVDLGDDVAVSGEQRLRRAHLGAQRQLAFGQPVGAVFLVLRSGRAWPPVPCRSGR